MSTKRTTRASSRQASSRGASPATSDMTATPRRAARSSGGTPLPAVNLRASTAYGTNTVPAFSVRAGQQAQQELGTALNDILKPVPEEEEEASAIAPHTRSRLGGRGQSAAHRAATPSDVDVNQTYGEESNVFKSAGFDTSSIASHDDYLDAAYKTLNHVRSPLGATQTEDFDELALGGRNDRHTPAGGNSSRNIAEDHDELALDGVNGSTALAAKKLSPPQPLVNQASHRKPRKPPPRTKPPQESPDTTPEVETSTRPIHPSLISIRNAGSWIYSKLSNSWFLWLLLIYAIIFLLSPGRAPSYSSAHPERAYNWYGWDLQHNIGQFIPNWIAHPIEALGPDDLEDVQSDIRLLDFKLKSITSLRNIDANAIAKIEKVLPDFLVVKKDKNGALQIPHDFWHAVRDLIRKDDTFIPTPDKKGEKLSASKSSKPEISIGWDKYLKANRARINAWYDSELEEKFPRLLKDNMLASKSEFLDMIRQNWDENQDGVKTELDKLTKDVDTLTKRADKFTKQLKASNTQIEQLQHEATSRNKEQLQALIAAYVRSILPIAQLQALVGANMNNLAQNHAKVNHWSPGTGAVVNPHVTSDNYVFPSMKKGFFEKVVRRYMMNNPVPIANPPAAALTKWEEHGDCWCTPAEVGIDSPKIGVISGSSIYPEEVVIEHIPPSASLEPASAPREMELLAYMAHVDFDTYKVVHDLSKNMFPQEPDLTLGPHELTKYIRIATWKYDLNSPENIQTFPVQLDLKPLLAHTNNLVVRAKNNWGGGKVEYTCLYRIRVHGEIGVKPGE